MKSIVIGLAAVVLAVTLLGIFSLCISKRDKKALQYTPTGFYFATDTTKMPYIDLPEEWEAIEGDTMVVTRIHGAKRDTLRLEFANQNF